MAHRESIVNLQMVAMITDQRRIAQASKKDGNALKRLSMMGAVFLPGTFIASLFSMVFFNFHGVYPLDISYPNEYLA
jgi:Mg2+ and Co2+ transporter CorA